MRLLKLCSEAGARAGITRVVDSERCSLGSTNRSANDSSGIAISVTVAPWAAEDETKGGVHMTTAGARVCELRHPLTGPGGAYLVRVECCTKCDRASAAWETC